MMTDAEFVREVQAYEKTLYRVSRTILSSDADCCDAVQEALTRAWKHRNDVNPRFFKTWLLRILINECHNIGRRLKRMIPVEEMPEWPAPQAEETGVMEALQRIKEPWRIVLIMHELEGFTYAEIASVTRVPENTVKYRAVQARRALRREIERQCALPGFVDSKNEEKTERNAGYLVVSHSGGGMLRQGTRKGIRRTPANRGMRAHRIVKSLDISEDVCHGLCP